MSGEHVFVDESKGKDYLLVAAVVLPADVSVARRTMKGLALPGQHAVHMYDERDARKKLVLSTIAALSPRVTIYRAPKDGRTELARREACLRALVGDCIVGRHAHLCLDRDDTLVERDRRQLFSAARAAGVQDVLLYRHEKAMSEPLLVMPDAIAWAYAKGGPWRELASSVIVAVRDV